ncbi:MATE family efflux transporter [Halalkalibacter hemicellulosilyticus]|uniref:Cation efflux pump n=1 Tax=Halalkalibacter hemicellulosilyticusJCM 9152 TaxID=1236971 RepID=W4QJN9_9BACI|nr:MATE family efflux transporter [Halalkalibacter hemicellulosilyticus]GAE32340.1 cation efflux pump [Halalkalibacter hemicellulosilyticusJCM 9152]
MGTLEKDKAFYKRMMALSVPITIQFLLTSFLSMVDSLMVGQLGEVSIASVGVANKITIILILITQGFASGAGIFAAQYWGRKDKVGISKILMITTTIISGFTIVASFFVVGFANQLINLFSPDQAVVELGSSYIKIIAISYFFTGITIILTVILRSMGEVKVPMYFSVFAILLNTLLNYLFIFGNGGFPELGIEGAAIATVIARVFHCVLMVLLIRQFNLFSTFRHIDMKEVFESGLIKSYFVISVPSILNHIFWTLGETSYFWVFARMGTNELAAATLIDPLIFLFMAVFIGLGDAASVMIGNSIGSERFKETYQYAKKFLWITLGLSIVASAGVLLVAPFFVSFYNISSSVAEYATSILYVYAIILPFKMLNQVNNIGILRAGGDTKFVMYLDLIGVWFVGLPLALIGAYAGFPIYIVFGLANTQEIARILFGLKRTLSRKWMNVVVREESKLNVS